MYISSFTEIYIILIHATIFFGRKLAEFAYTKIPIPMLNILIACDHKISREALAAILSAEPMFNVIDICADTLAAIAITEREKPDIVFIDGSTDALAASQATKKIRASFNASIIAVSRQKDPHFARHMLTAGALGYLTSQSSSNEIVAAVCAVANHYIFNCLENNYVPTKPAGHFSALKYLIESLFAKSRKTKLQLDRFQWHGILRHTN